MSQQFSIQGEVIAKADIDTQEEELHDWAGTKEAWYRFDVGVEYNDGCDLQLLELIDQYDGPGEPHFYWQDYDGGAPGCSGSVITITSKNPAHFRNWLRSRIAAMIREKRDWIRELREDGHRFYPIRNKPIGKTVNADNIAEHVLEILKINQAIRPTGRYSRELPSGKSINYDCSTLFGAWHKIHFTKYLDRFGDGVTWFHHLVPKHLVDVCELALAADTPLPDELPELEEIYLEHMNDH
jgi:hypothetical protein